MWGYGEGGQLPKRGRVRDVASVAVLPLRMAQSASVTSADGGGAAGGG